jgi:hypothetical protein
MSPDEADRLLAMAGSLRVRVMLALGYGCVLARSCVSELATSTAHRWSSVSFSRRPARTGM